MATLVLGALAVSVPALAQPAPIPEAKSASDLEQAREAYRAALAMETAGDWAGALTRINEVATVKLTPQVRFHLARCQDKLGRWTEAVGSYRMAIAEAEVAGVADVVREATAALAVLEPAVPRLSITRGADAAGATVFLDGVALGDTSIGTPLAVDPGPHRIDARLGARQLRSTVTLAPRERRSFVVELPTERSSAPAAPAPAEPRDVAPSRAAAYGALGVGVVGLGLAGTFWALRAGTVSDLDDQCVDGHCPPSLESTSDRGKAFTVAAAAGLAVGVAGVAAFSWLLLREPAPPGKPAAATVRARSGRAIDGARSGRAIAVGVGPGAVALGGRF